MIKFILLSLLATSVQAQSLSTDERIVGVFYMTPILGHVHQAPTKISASLTTIQCGHPVQVIESSKVSIAPEWSYVQVADYRGFVLKQYLAEKKTSCFQGNYPKFFDGLNLDLSELYYWGRLYDHYVQGETRVQ